MDETKNIKNYYNGITSFYNYLMFYLGGEDLNDNLIMYKEHIKSAKVAFLSVFFTTEKEALVEKSPTEELKNNFGSKIIDDALVKSIEIIAKKNGDYYEIGNYKEENPANIIALIRNKFAHGRYEIDAENNLVILNDKSGNLNLELDLDKLYLLVHTTLINLIKFPKTSSITRVHAFNKHVWDLGITKIETKEDAKLLLRSSRFKAYTLRSLKDEEISKKVLEAFNYMLAGIKTICEKNALVKYGLDLFNKLGEKDSVQVLTHKRKLKDEDIEYILGNINLEEMYELDLKDQAQLLLSRAVEYLEPNYRENGILNGLLYNMKLLSMMEEKNFDFNEFSKDDNNKCHVVKEESVVSTLIAEFMVLYIYPLERIYLDGDKTTIDRDNQLDFGLLDLSKFNPSKITIYTSPLEQEEILYNSRLDILLKKYNDLIKQRENLRKVKESGNTKAISILESKVESDTLTLTELAYDTSNIVDSYNSVRDDYRNNPEYYRNRAIIEGIRNAIAHGNIKIKKTNSIDDTVIIFKDIYNGEVNFELEITVNEFSSLFNERNVSLIARFLNNRGTTKLGTLDIKRYIKE